MSSERKKSRLKIAAWVLLGLCIVYFGPAIAGSGAFQVLFFLHLATGCLLLSIDSRRQNGIASEASQAPKLELFRIEPPPARPQPSPPPRPIKGLLNGRYEIVLKQWKRGGMAIVHLAKDWHTNTQCVIKVPRLDTEHSPKLNIEKLKIEAEYLRKCSHPNIVRFIDQFTGPDGQFHLVEEYIEGNDLLTAFAKTTAEEHKVIKWAVQILDALIHIHGSGMVHRDLNPKNVMLTRDEKIVLIDFGTIRSSADLSGTVTIFTTLGFSAPEVTKGFTDERSDIYGVGSIMLYMLTSQRVGYIGNRNLVDYLTSRGVSPRTAKCIDQALQIDPAFRFQTAAAMRRAILGD